MSDKRSKRPSGKDDVPEGAAVFPEIPAALGVGPLTLAVLHAVVFLGGSDEQVVHAEAADEALQHIISYLQRLKANELERLRRDLQTLVAHGRREKWADAEMEFLTTFLQDCGLV